MVHRIVVLASLMTALSSMTVIPAIAAVSGGSLDAVSDATIPLPAGKFSKLYLLGSGVNGKQANQSFTVTYTDGTTTRITQSLSDWWGPSQDYPGETPLMQMDSLVGPTGASLGHVVYLYGYTLAIDGAKTVRSLTLPPNRNVVLLGIGAGASGAAPVHVNLAAVENVVGVVNAGTAAARGGLDNGGDAYAANLLGSSITWAGSTYALGGPASTTGAALTVQITGTPATSAVMGQFYDFTPTVVASAGSTLSYAIANKPIWAQFNAATGALTGVPPTGSAATDANILVSVSNGVQRVSLPPFTIAVHAASTGGTGTASLIWTRPTENTDGSPLTNLAGYIIRYGTSSSALDKTISVGSPGATSVEITNLTPGNWDFAVSSVNTENVESPFSAVVAKTIP